MKLKNLHIILIILTASVLTNVYAGFFPLKLSGSLSGMAEIYPEQKINYLTVFSRDSVLLDADPAVYRSGAEFDSTYRFAIVYERLYDQEIKPSRIINFDDFISAKLKHTDKNLWLSSVSKNLGIESASLVIGNEIALDIPFKIKSRTFHRVFGGSNIGLRVKGSLSISLTGQKSYTDVVNAENESFDFTLDQTQNISIRGKVGTKVDVDIAQNTESFDFENSLKITYTGESDEIIQKLEAGNIGLSLPGTKYVSFSGVNNGLFGLKAQTKLGKLKSTSIMSFEKGKKNQIEVKGGVKKQEKTVNAKDFTRYKYFFLEDMYRENYTTEENYRRLKEDLPLIAPEYKIKNYSLELYVTRKGTGSQPKADIYVDFIDSVRIEENQWVMLVDEDQYEVFNELGYIRLRSLYLSGSDILAARYVKQNVVTNETDSVGSSNADNTKLKLKILAEFNQKPTDPWDDLEWKNVYNPGGVDIPRDGFKLTIRKNAAGGVRTEEYDEQGQAKPYLYWYDVNKTEVLDEVDVIFLNSAFGEFTFPNQRPFDPDLNSTAYDHYDEVMVDSLFSDPEIYDNYSYTGSNFELKFEFSSKSSTYDLGFNVIDGSEVVRSGATTLKKDVDYIINYNSGQLSIINERYLTADIDILYESATIFQMDQKLLLGNRLEYSFGENSYIGATILYLSEETNEERVHVGYEPKRNLVLDLNGETKFDLPYLTRAADWLPLIETDQNSEISFEGEIARIYPNPNPLDAAYIDDFESSKIKKSLGITYGSWTESSYPDDYSASEFYSLTPEASILGIPYQYFLKAYSGRDELAFYWYNPKDEDRFTKDQIYRDIPADQRNDKVNTLSMVFKPTVTSEAVLGGVIEPEDSWAGVMRYLHSSYQDMRDVKYIEFLASSNRKITLNIDIGELSEDVIPDGQLNTEDADGNNVLDIGDDNEDTGLDGVMGTGDFNALFTFDPNAPRDKEPYEFKSFDDHPTESDGDPTPDSQMDKYWNFCKTERNGRLDSEDLDGGGNLDRIVNAYRYTLDLKSSPGLGEQYIVSTEYESGFALYRIPLEEFTSVLNSEPDISRMKYIKLWVNNSTDTVFSTKIDFVNFDLVGNEWAAKGDNVGKIEAKTINNEEDKEDYYSPPGVKKLNDDGYPEPEQSLSMNISLSSYLTQDEFENGRYAFLTKQLFKGENYLLYEQIKMFIHGGTSINDTAWDSGRDMYFIYRFGTDSVNFYEYRSKLINGWKNDDVNNQMVIELSDLTRLKTARSDGGHSVDSLFLKEYKNENIERYIGIRGNPTLQAVKYFNAGILDLENTELNTEIWLDELRLAKVMKEPGTAMRAKTHLKIADIGTVDAEMTKQDQEFHRIEETRGTGVNSLNTSFNASMNLDKLTPKKWGLALPVRYSYNNSDSYTKYESTTDILVDENNIPDSVRTRTTRNSYDFSIRKNSKSKSPYIKYTLDNMNLTGNASFSDASNASYISQKTESYNYTLGYGLTLPDSWFSINPFGWGKDMSLFKSISGVKFAFFPNSYNFSVTTSQSETASLSRKLSETESRSFSLTRNFSTSLTPLPFLNSSYALTMRSDMYKDAVRDSSGNESIVTVYNRDLGDLFSLEFGELSSFDNSLKNNMKFNMYKYMTNDLSFNTGYTWTSNLSSTMPSSNIKNRYDSKLTSRLKVKTVIEDIQSGLKKILPEKKVTVVQDSTAVPEDKDEKDAGATRFQRTKVSVTEKKSVLDFLKTNLSDISLSYSQGRENSFSDIKSLDQANAAFILGFATRPEDLDYTSSGWSGSWSVKSNTKLGLTKNLSLDGISYDFSRSYKENNNDGFSGSDSETKFIWPWVTDEEHRKTGTNPFMIPNYSLTISGLQEMLKAKESISSISISHSKTGSEATQWYVEGDSPEMYLTGIPELAGTDLKIRSVSYSTSFTPLAGIRLNLKNGFNFSASYNYSFDMREAYTYSEDNRSIQSGEKKYSRDFRFSAGYNQKGGFDVPFDFWPFNGKRLDNDIDYSLSVSYNSNDTHKYDLEAKEYEGLEDGSKSDNITITPDITYKVSRKLNGTLSYSYNYNETKNYNARSVINTNHKVELRAVLSITGN